MAARNTPSRGSKPDKLMRDALRVALHREAVDADGKPTKRLNIIADRLVEAAMDGDMTAIREIFDRIDGKVVPAVDANEPRGDVTYLINTGIVRPGDGPHGIMLDGQGRLIEGERAEAEDAEVVEFASRSIDRARPAYGRFPEARPRKCIFVGTTNDDKYLRDRTGNRRFCPVKTGKIDLEALARDRDQLWAEAAHYEAKGEPLVIPETLWPAAAAEQNKRLEDDPWQDKLAEIKGTVADGKERERLWKQMVEIYPPYLDYQKATDRKIPVVVLDPTP